MEPRNIRSRRPISIYVAPDGWRTKATERGCCVLQAVGTQIRLPTFYSLSTSCSLPRLIFGASRLEIGEVERASLVLFEKEDLVDSAHTHTHTPAAFCSEPKPAVCTKRGEEVQERKR